MNKLMQTLLLVLVGIASSAFAPKVYLEHARININDNAAIARGATMFKQQCVACHSLKYLDHDQVASKAGLTLEIMPLHNKDWTFATAPPDLSLVARSRGPDWVYSYLISFYQDDLSSHGSNNLILPGTSMPNPFAGQQGVQIQMDPNNLRVAQTPRIHNILRLKSKGSQSIQEFEAQIKDLITFLSYASEPTQQQRKSLGPWVILFLLVFTSLAYMLKQEYWRDID